MKFIHTADLHLDSPFLGLTAMPQNLWGRVHASTFDAFKQIVDDAISLQVDFVLISGDIYDRDQQSIEATDFFAKQCERLNQAEIPVYLLYGNHDYQVVSRNNNLPANVHVFGNQVTTEKLTLANHETIAISGFSYDQRWIGEDQVVRYPQKAATDWHIGMLHGALRQATDNHYAPFTVAELQTKNYDYWALGHIHKHQVLTENPPIVYNGNPQGRHKNENGQHGYYLVESQGKKLIPTFKSIAKIEWTTIEVPTPEVNNLAEFETNLLQEVAEMVKKQPFQLVELVVKTTDNVAPQIQHLLANGEVLDHLQAKGIGGRNWWIYDLVLTSSTSLPSMTDLDEQYWQQAATTVFTTANILDLTATLAKDPILADKLMDIDPQKLKDAVTQLLEQGELDQ